MAYRHSAGSNHREPIFTQFQYSTLPNSMRGKVSIQGVEIDVANISPKATKEVFTPLVEKCLEKNSKTECKVILDDWNRENTSQIRFQEDLSSFSLGLAASSVYRGDNKLK